MAATARCRLISGTALLLFGRCIQFHTDMIRQRAGVTALGVTLLSFHGWGFGIPGGIDIATIFMSAVFAPVKRIT